MGRISVGHEPDLVKLIIPAGIFCQSQVTVVDRIECPPMIPIFISSPTVIRFFSYYLFPLCTERSSFRSPEQPGNGCALPQAAPARRIVCTVFSTLILISSRASNASAIAWVNPASCWIFRSERSDPSSLPDSLNMLSVSLSSRVLLFIYNNRTAIHTF